MFSLVLAVALSAQPTPTPCVPDLQAGGQPLRPCAPPKPVLMAVSDAAPVAPPEPVASIEYRGPEIWPASPAALLISPPRLGDSCDAEAKRVAAIQAATPAGEPVAQAYKVTCRAGKIVAVSPPVAEVMPNLYRAGIGCQAVANEITRRIETSVPRKRMAATYAVMRQVDGCGVPTPVGYHPDYLAPGAADPQSTKPADAPARRR